jgi:hypothetical protein
LGGVFQVLLGESKARESKAKRARFIPRVLVYLGRESYIRNITKYPVCPCFKALL